VSGARWTGLPVPPIRQPASDFTLILVYNEVNEAALVSISRLAAHATTPSG